MIGPWRQTTPFGSPVEPEVKATYAGLSAVTIVAGSVSAYADKLSKISAFDCGTFIRQRICKLSRQLNNSSGSSPLPSSWSQPFGWAMRK